ncbi:hypothetical protein [Serpentinicella alkaliphila]|uniref:Uncharacterized protein n=1 Tax=Serpentinicella alkaliphila TaxID=1734049 RepID=A0A4R2TJS2_9FIRM|nr:hypothetical protein [Serpentinicella alkaliphila]TCQ02602.1 hypothetical protein EDD79_101416 [Serpentinicella alkaliphila]
MAFKPNVNQQLNINDNFLMSNDGTKKFVLNSCAKGFSEVVFPAINEKDLLYCTAITKHHVLLKYVLLASKSILVKFKKV